MNNVTRQLFTFFFLICVAWTVTVAQPRTSGTPTSPTTKAKLEVLTNATIIELAQLGLSEAVMLEKIRQSEGDFDTSINGLKQLKAAKVSDAIIAAMLKPKASIPAPATPTATVAGKTSAPTATPDALAPREPGIYFQQQGALIEINPTTFTGTKSSFLGTTLTYGIKKTKMRAVVRGAAANTVIANSRPTFYFSFDPSLASPGMAMSGFLSFGATSPGEFVLVRMERKNNSRETVLAEISAFGSSTGTRDKDIQDFSFEKIKPGVFKVTPKAPLEVGEYCFYYAGAVGGLGMAGGKLFDFSVTLPAM